MKAVQDPSGGDMAALPGRGCARPGEAWRAFSLTELLVVIAVLALMAALMLPALSKAKQQGTAASCLNNQKQLGNALHMYTQDNSDRIVQMADYNTGADIFPAGGYWGGPAAPPSTWTGPDSALAAVQKGLRSSNAYYFYCNEVGVYHCPGDVRIEHDPTTNGPNGWAYDSYSRTENLGGEPYDDYWGAGATYTKMSAIPKPGMTFSMIEAADWRGYNVGTWAVRWEDGSFRWVNPPAVWHIDVGTIGFADGHVELHKWTDPAIVAAGRMAAQGTPANAWAGPTDGADYLYVYNGYQFPGHP
jgi:prepilin-type N-terminal cleavage/methylation domain-containing protein/prepilin-type processing-associated H-X9-DG protein